MQATADQKLGRNYDRAAWFYEASANIYSTGQIKAAKLSQLKYLSPGQSILYLGVGAGEDAIRAARAGLHVTCIDISQGMLDRVQRKLDRENLQAELICVNAFEHQRLGHYDAVATNFFLNCFKKPAMQEMLRHAVSLVKPGGRFFVADVSPPQGNILERGFNVAYSKWAMSLFWMMKLVPWHENFDYANELRTLGIEVNAVENFRLAKAGPILFTSISATCPGSAEGARPGTLATNAAEAARRVHTLGQPHRHLAQNRGESEEGFVTH